jgi:hypothetical protein
MRNAQASPNDFKTRAKSTSSLKADKAKLLRSAYERLTRAKKLGSHIEVVAILETLLSDRLEVLDSIMSGSINQVDTLGRLLARVKKYDAIPERLLSELLIWSKSRNLAVHQLVKITNANEADFNRRIAYIRSVGQEGEILLSELKRLVDKVARSRKLNND